MALIRALPAEQYSSFRSLLLMQPTITLSSLMDQCRIEETNRRPTLSGAPSSSALAAQQSASSSGLSCFFCGRSSHVQKDCRQYAAAMEKAKADAKGGRQRSKKGKANAAQETTADTSSSPSTAASTSQQAANSAQLAVNASLSSSSSSTR